MFVPVAVLLTSLSALILNNAIPLSPSGGWQVEVGPGVIVVDGRELALAEPVKLHIAPPAEISIPGEAHVLPVFNDRAGGWLKGVRLKALITQECTAAGLLQPESVVVRNRDGTLYTLGRDYALDPLWGTVGRLAGGDIGADETVVIDYIYNPSRLDSIVANQSGEVRWIPGRPAVGLDPPPPPGSGERLIGTVWIPGKTKELTAENLFPVELPTMEPAPLASEVAERLLPRTLAKLQTGEPLKVVAWGDSVTYGGGVRGDDDAWYQHQFIRRLEGRFPKADITLTTAAWPGAGSHDYLEAPPGGEFNFERDVLNRKPDLVICEWVNDSYLKGEALVAHYSDILEKLREVGAEVVFLTPHFVRPDWMGVDTLKFDEDPRPYVQGLRRFAEANAVALADGARHWSGLWRQGIPYTTLLANSINHPDVRGHALLSDALMELFPE